jgi:NADPH-dependent glutamate synthase beta subunit-like oxidoreductase/NAD(P)H-flavin reductase
MTDLRLAHDLAFADLYDPAGLARIDALFLEDLRTRDASLADRLVAGRADPGSLTHLLESTLLLELGPAVEAFVARLFGIEREADALAAAHRRLEILFECKRNFVQRTAAKAHTPEESQGYDGTALRADLTARFGGRFDQETYAAKVMEWLADKDANAEALDVATRYADWALFTGEGKRFHRDDILFLTHDKTEYEHLVPCREIELHGVTALEGADGEFLHRDGFGLTDRGTDTAGELDQAHYCVICHDRDRDNCRHGTFDKQGGGFARNPLGVRLEGCPLDEKISEMHRALMDGHVMAALAIVVVDNPMLAGTGHRICNDCMKSCIYQKQEPVNIPQTETRMLKNVLGLPWGFEIYSLLTRWNPMNLRRPVARPDSGYKVLVVGSGPAGYTLSHYLLNEGHAVVCIDGLKIEPLAADLSGVARDGTRVPFRPIRDVTELFEDLDERTQAGFGGVAEYGITVRWDKNFLKVLRLLVERRPRYALFGGVRFGSAVTAESAYAMGFDHVALAMGAGKPTFLDIPNNLARGVRTASDFLMALQLTGAAKKDSVANLQLRLPVVVIGGGLTAIDTATESLAYYVRQVDKFLARYEILVAEQGEELVRAAYRPEEAAIADEFLAHGRALRAERERARAEGREPRFVPMLREWGGATIAYRRKMTSAPAYQLNHEEIVKAFEQGIRFAELLSPKAIEVDGHEHVSAIRLIRQRLDDKGGPVDTDEEVVLPARAVLIAAGTTPNTVLTREHPGFAVLDGKYFQAVDEDFAKATPARTAKPDQAVVLMNPRPDGRCMSFLGDLHPSFAGNVVKAMASARRGYPVVDRALRRRPPEAVPAADLLARLNAGLRATVHDIRRLTAQAVQVTLKAPMAAAAFQPGQFYRIQNYEADSAHVDGTVLAMEGVALTGAIVDKGEGLVSLIAMDMGGSTTILQTLKPGQPVVLMGPTGVPTHVSAGDTALLCGGGLGNAVLMTISKAFKEAGAKVLYFAAYKGVDDRFHVEAIQKNTDLVVWCCDEAPGFVPTRPQDKAFVGNIVQAMVAYAEGKLGAVDIPLDSCNHLIAIGSDRMMEAVQQARHAVLKPHLKPDHIGIASINSPMQCMMKEICGQCLQKHRDPDSGKESIVYSCFRQDQPIDRVVFPALRERLCQNAVHEKLTRQWIARGLARLGDKVTRV